MGENLTAKMEMEPMMTTMDPLSYSNAAKQPKSTMRRRNVADYDGMNSGGYSNSHGKNGYGSPDKKSSTIKRKVVRKLDLFPKVEQDLTVKTEQGGIISLIGYVIIFCLVLAEVVNHMNMSKDTSETLIVDTR